MGARALVFYCGLLLTMERSEWSITLPLLRCRCASTSVPVMPRSRPRSPCTSASSVWAGWSSDRCPTASAGARPSQPAWRYFPDRRGDCAGRAVDRDAAGRSSGAGLRCAVGPVVARAILRDLFSGPKLAQPGDRHRHLFAGTDPGAADRCGDRAGGRFMAQHLRGHAGVRRPASDDPGACARDPADAASDALRRPDCCTTRAPSSRTRSRVISCCWVRSRNARC